MNEWRDPDSEFLLLSKADSWNGELSWLETRREDFQLPKEEVKLDGIIGM
jgi:hypothetical protein